MPFRMIKVKEIMNRRVPTVGPETAVSEVVSEMVEHGESCAVVIDAEHRPLGLVTERDVMSSVLAEDVPRGRYLQEALLRLESFIAHLDDCRKARARVAREIMSAPAVCIDEDASLTETAGVMAAHNFRQLPVVRRGVVVGLVTRAYLVGAVARSYAREAGSQSNG